MTRRAAGIGGGDLRARLNLDLPAGELGRLARTFDGMLARIEDAFGSAASAATPPTSGGPPLKRGADELAWPRRRDRVARL